MKAEESKLTTIFADSKTYEIPRYQRPYSWSEAHAHDLVNDTFEAFEAQEKEYFIGSIITIEKSKDGIFDVVDGQQRLTTLTILFSTLRSMIRDEGARSELQKRILPINALTKAPQTARLSVRQQDQKFFKRYILLGEDCTDKLDLSETQIKFIKNAEIFKMYFEGKDEATLCHFANYLLENVYVVFVKTESFHSAYRLFNVLNARGMSLSNSDLIKNSLFELSINSTTEQDNIEENWSELESIVGLSNLDKFLSHQRTSLKGEKQLTTLIKEYKDYLETGVMSVTQFLDDVVKSAKNYQRILTNDFEDIHVRVLFISLSQVSHDEWIPPILSFMNKYGCEKNFEKYVRLIEKITYQHWIRRLGKTKRNTVYYHVISLINKGATFAEIEQKILDFADNADFLAILAGDFYGAAYDTAVLLRLERDRQDTSVTKIFSGVISIEHIMPQRLGHEYWTKRFSETEHKNFVHKMGNLTLLSGKKNSAASNSDFEKKLIVYDKKNSKVSFDMTKAICSLRDWDLDALMARQSAMLSDAKAIWEIN